MHTCVRTRTHTPLDAPPPSNRAALWLEGCFGTFRSVSDFKRGDTEVIQPAQRSHSSGLLRIIFNYSYYYHCYYCYYWNNEVSKTEKSR